jgi:Putative Flp pilus-assembly TadE/G-like
MRPQRRDKQLGQALALFALALAAIVAGVGVVVDGGYAYAQRRVSQNAADFAAMAGTRIIGQKQINNPPGSGTAANVTAAIQAALAANDATLVDADYVDEDGAYLGEVVGASSIPNSAFGVVVSAKTDWKPFLLGMLGITDWAATSQATAKTPGRSLGGGVLPVGIQNMRFNGLVDCPLTNLSTCINQNLTSGSLNIPGGFGWLKFGIQGNGGKCDWASLGMLADGGCQSSKTYLDTQIGPPANSHGCCTSVGLAGSTDQIGSLTGNEWGDLSFYIDNRVPVWVPIWDVANANGANGYYHIVGFGAIVFTGDNEHAKWLEGAAIADACTPGTEIAGSNFCTTPGGPFILDATGEVQLIR